MNKMFLGAAASALLCAATAAPALAQDGQRHERHERGDRDRDRGGWDRDDRRGGQWDRRGDHRRHDRDDDAGRVIGSILGGFLLGENLNYRFRYDDDYYRSRGYDRRRYDHWRNRDRGQGCYSVGYRRGCRTIYYSRDFMILNLQGEVYCYRRTYRRGWTPTYCPRNWYDY